MRVILFLLAFAFAITCGGAPVVSTVQDVPGYNSWPMVQALGKRLVCAYSRGTAHRIEDPVRGVFVRYSDDGGRTWSPEAKIVDYEKTGEVTIGKGLDENGAMLLWVRCWGPDKHHELYRSVDGEKFEKLAVPALDPVPMQITDIIHVPGIGMMSLWFSDGYRANADKSWGTLVSADGGRSWTQHTVENGLERADWPTEPSGVWLGNGRILVIARSEGSTRHQFQLVSKDSGKTWRKYRTNITDVAESTPSLIFEAESGQVFNYYYQRGAKKLKRRVAKAEFVFDHPSEWPEPEELFEGWEKRAYDAGNVNVTTLGDRHCAATYTGSEKDTSVLLIAAEKTRMGWPVLKTYEGESLRRIKMPMGGIGTGTFSLAGNGGLVDWAIFNTPAIGNTPTANDVASGFLIRTEDADGKVSARLLEGPIDTSLYDGGEGCRIPNHAFPRFRDCTFKAAYPLAQVELKDDSMPVTARLEAMNPLVTNNAAASGIPAVLLRWNVRNVTAKPVKVSVMGMLVNPTGGAPFEDKDDKSVDVMKVDSPELTGVGIFTDELDACDNTCGQVAMSVPKSVGVVSRASRISDPGWMVRFDRSWKQFMATGRADDLRDLDAGRWTLPMGTVAVQVELAPGETKAIPFVVAWRYPHRPCWSGRGYRDTPIRGPFDPKRDVGNFYATRYRLAMQAADDLWKDLPKLEQKTVAFVDGVLAAKIPAVVKEAAIFNLSTLRCETCFRTADGHFYGWEGIFETGGSCFGSCTHVWGYEHALADLWPELARDMTELQFEHQMGDDGHIAFRIQLPLASSKASEHMAAADGQLQCIIKAYENWKKGGTGADDWLKRLWPKIRKAVEFCWIPGGWDADCDGVMEGCQHNTMDVEYYGPNPQMEFLYLAALKAAAAMADARGDTAFAKKCRSLFVVGSAWTESNLFNGEWYEHKVVPPTVAPARCVTSGAAQDLSNPDYQLAAGCLVDQLLGDYAARHVGLGAVADERNANKTLDTILAKNASANVGLTYNCGRDYAMSEEPSLKMAWYPEGRMPKKPFPYYGENMTGFEYVVAANLAQRGRFAEAEKVVGDIRNRYDGRKRNPFDEAECGHHYSRALAAWSVLKAFDTQIQQQTKESK